MQQHYICEGEKLKGLGGVWSVKNSLNQFIAPLEPCVWGHATATERAPGKEVAELRPNRLLAVPAAFNQKEKEREREKEGEREREREK